jgi:hypothetical protein
VLPLATLILPQAIEGVGVTDCNFHGPPVAILDRSVLKKASTGGGGFLCPVRWMRCWASRRTPTTRMSRPGNTACHSPHQA